MKIILLLPFLLAVMLARAKTVAYWPMTETVSGEEAKVRCAVASENDLFVNAAAESAAFSDCDIGWNLPPNPETSATAALAGGFLVRQMVTNTAEKVAVLTNGCSNLAAVLSAVNDFTVEGWVKTATLPAKIETKATTQMFLYMTSAEPGGWNWFIERPANSDALQISVVVSYLRDNGSVGPVKLVVADGLKDDDFEGEWHHVALVHTSSDRGWAFYLDGVLKGNDTADDNNYGQGEFSEPSVCLNGAQSSVAKSLVGSLACWRVSDRALDPAEFLYGSKAGTVVAEPATKTAAYWKLDRKADGSVDASDFVGGFDLTAGSGGPVAQTDAVAVLNPDSSFNFRGDSAENGGSVQVGTAQTDRNKYFYSTDKDLLSVFSAEEGWTVEGYVKRSAVHANFGVIFGLCKNTDMNGNSVVFALRAVGNGETRVGYTLFDNTIFGNVKTEEKIVENPSALPINCWVHIALSLSYVTENDIDYVNYVLYTNAAVCATVKVQKRDVKSSFEAVVFGGVANTDRNFAGSLDSFRVSRGALDPSEFLCAASAQTSPVAVTNLAYWPLENKEGAADGKVTAGFSGYGFYEKSGTVGGVTDRARRSVRAETGLPAANSGSVEIGASGTFAAANVGYDLNFGASWSVEGYYRSEESATAFICGTYDETLGSGWKLVADRSGITTSFRLVAAAGSDPFIDTAFSGVGKFVEGEWNHLLLTHDRNGTWTLTVNGAVAGTLSSIPRRAAATTGVSSFRIGDGDYDLWRATSGILSVEDSLYAAKPGMVIYFQ